jgi:uncharacterized protein YbaR (Trm112 family)
MHILLTDALACPRCGPDFGLVLLADRIEDRQVLQGSLGCPNCRETYRITDGAADLRTTAAPAGPEPDAGAGAPHADPQEAAVRVAALLGLADATGTVLLAGPGAVLAPHVSALVPGVRVVAYTSAPAPNPASPGVDPVAGGPRLPFRSGALRGVALTGGATEALLAEALRALAPGARLVVEPADPGTAGALRGLGANVMLEEEAAVVAGAVGRPVPLTRNAVR